MSIPTAADTATGRAGALLEAIARDSDTALDFEVPLRCGRAADLLPHSGFAVPRLADEYGQLAAALGQALALLESLSAVAVTGAVLDAVTETRAATAACLID
jgi:hypothetical protein